MGFGKSASVSQRDHYQEINNQIVEALEAGIIHWRREWDQGACGVPMNVTTGKAYRGINHLVLGLAQAVLFTDDPRWCSYRQAQAKGWQVRKGERGTMIVFFKRIEKLGEAEAGDEPCFYQLLKCSTVFHASQIEGIPDYARALDRRRLYARDAAFDDTLAKVHGIVWLEDLFAEGDRDNRYTTQINDYLGAQHEHMSNKMPKKGIILTLDSSGDPKLPPKAERIFGPPRKGDILGHYVSDRTGKIEVIAYRMPEEKAKSKVAGKEDETVVVAGTTDGIAVKTRAPVTQTGMSMIGDFRNAALHKAFAEDEIDDLTLIGLLVLAFCGDNVDVRTGMDDESLCVRGRDILAARIAPSGATPPQTKNAVSLYGLTLTKSDEISARFWEIVDRRINEAPELVEMLADRYQREMNGGGCLAWRKNFHDGSYLFITYYEHDIGGEPEDPVWIVGRYTDHGEENCVDGDEFLTDVTLGQAKAFARDLEVIYSRRCCHPASCLERGTGK
jgi:hypothetical protein